MTGLKSGSGDDLWDDDTEDDEERNTDEEGEPDEQASETEPGTMTESESTAEDESVPAVSESSSEPSNRAQPYIVRRAVQDKSVQFERDERLTFFVHDDVADGERELLTEVESALGRDVPKFDVREAVYRAALRNRDDVLEELLEMGYSQESNDS